MTAALARVGDLATQVRGVSYGKEDASATPLPGYLPVIRAGNITDNGLVFDDLVYVPSHRISPQQRIRRHDVVIAASSGSLDVVGKASPALADFEGGFGAFCKVLRPATNVHGPYFAHFFKTQDYRRRVSALAAGANINNLRTEHLDELQIPLPALPEQRRIAEVLDRAEALRAKRRASIAQLEILTQSIFLDLFGDPGSAPAQIKKVPLQELCGVDSSLVNPTLPQYETLLHYGPDRIERDTGVLLPAKTAKEDGLTSGKFLFEADCVLYSKIRPNLNKVALATQRGLCSADMYPLSVRPGIATREFVWRLLLSKDFLKYADSQSNRANIPKLNRDQLLAYPALCPPFSSQREFSRRITVVEKMKTTLRNSLVQMNAFFAILQHRAFRGEI